jgi:hypothetical protein
VRAARVERELAALAAGTDTIIAGPWLGEVGFELLYWVPFLAWFAERFDVAPERLLIVSRGGTASWYRGFAQGYREIFDRIPPAEFRRRHDERVSINGEQKQTRVLAFERDLLRALTGDVRQRKMLHPSTMYALFGPFWWTHVDERWVMRRTRYRPLTPPALELPSRPPYVAVKFYFNDCFPPTPANRGFVRRLLARLVSRGRVVSLTTGLQLDDHHGVSDVQALGIEPLPGSVEPRDNLALQTAVVAGAASFVGTYGGFAYLAPFHGVPATAYYSDAAGFSARHLLMARAALAGLGGRGGLLDVQPVSPPPAAAEETGLRARLAREPGIT